MSKTKSHENWGLLENSFYKRRNMLAHSFVMEQRPMISTHKYGTPDMFWQLTRCRWFVELRLDDPLEHIPYENATFRVGRGESKRVRI